MTARIGKITPKNGGAQIRVLHQRAPEDNLNGEIIRYARIIAENDSEMMGFTVVAFFADGSHSHGTRLKENAAVGRTMFPSFVADVIRRDIIVEPIAWGEL